MSLSGFFALVVALRDQNKQTTGNIGLDLSPTTPEEIISYETWVLDGIPANQFLFLCQVLLFIPGTPFSIPRIGGDSGAYPRLSPLCPPTFPHLRQHPTTVRASSGL